MMCFEQSNIGIASVVSFTVLFLQNKSDKYKNLQALLLNSGYA